MTKKEFYLSIAGKGDFFAPMKSPVKSDIVYRYVSQEKNVKPLVMKDGRYFISSPKSEIEETTVSNRTHVAILTFKNEGKLKKEVIFKDLRRKQ